MKNIISFALALIMAAALTAYPAFAQSGDSASDAEISQEESNCGQDKADEGQEVNPFTLIKTTNLKGENFDAQKLCNRPIIINVWAHWCGPCRKEMPVLTKLASEYGGRITFLGLLPEAVKYDGETIKKDEEAIKQGLEAQENLNIGFETLVPDEILLSAVYQTQLQAFPTTWFINERGQLVDISVGAMNEEQWRAKIETFISFLNEHADSSI